MALGEAIVEDRERAVALLIWAGANPHERVPELRWSRPDDQEDEEDHISAVALAILYGRGKLLRMLKPRAVARRFREPLVIRLRHRLNRISRKGSAPA